LIIKKCIAGLACAAALPVAAASYTVDKDHTYPSFEFSHMGISVWRGKFNRTSGKVNYDREARSGDVNIVVPTASIDFGHKAMNEAAIAADWLNTEQHPVMTYQGKLRFEGDTPVGVEGQLTLLGVTKPLSLKINQFKCIPHPLYRREYCGADAEGVLNRADWGLTSYAEGELGRIRMRIQVEAMKD
jgi:polyisoprenoid-binding protein YceI